MERRAEGLKIERGTRLWTHTDRLQYGHDKQRLFAFSCSCRHVVADVSRIVGFQPSTDSSFETRSKSTRYSLFKGLVAGPVMKNCYGVFFPIEATRMAVDEDLHKNQDVAKKFKIIDLKN